MTTRRPALIFDFGNVLAFFDYGRIGAILGRSLGLSGEEFLARARNVGFTALLQRYESGGMSSEEFGQAVAALMGFSLTHAEFAAAWSDIFWLNEPVAKLVADLKARGYTLVLGSNTNDLHATHFRRQFAEALAPFDRLVMSHEVGHIKPSAAFYLACAKAAQADPADCVFIDDLPENVEGARAAGLRAVLYSGDTDLLAKALAGMGVVL